MARKITLEEVKKHNQEKDLWVVHHGRVLDLTKFLNEHPGGKDVLMEGAGGDISQGFDDIGHSDDAKKMVADYVIGTLDTPDASSQTQNKVSSSTSPAPRQVTVKTDSSSIVLPVVLVVLAIVAFYFYS